MPTLDFKGKQFVYAHHLTVPFRQLDIAAKKSMPGKGKPSLDDNLIIHGDNLHGLKALLPQYAGKIKCIYIDPPYNTGEEGWCYNDNVNSPLMKEWLKDSANPVDKEDLERHDKWLCMMWPRLQLLRELLSEDGFIFINIDNNESHRLRMVMDEIFGEDNFRNEIITRRGIKNVQSQFEDIDNLATGHDTVYLYSKNRGVRLPKLMSITEDDEPGKWDTFWRGTDRGTMRYELFGQTPETGQWRWSEARAKEAQKNYEEYLDHFSESMSLDDYYHLREQETGMEYDFVRSNDEGVVQYYVSPRNYKLMSDVWMKIPTAGKLTSFPHEKHVGLVYQIVSWIAGPNDIVLDSFAGSGTTAHAVLALNKEDGGKRKFILIECEDYADEITAERVRRVIKGIPEAKDTALKEGLGGSFTYCELGQEINIENLLKGDKLPSYDELARYAYYTATGLTLDKVKSGGDYLVAENGNYRVHLVYKPDIDFLRSGESALNMPLAKSISKSLKDKKTALVFATHKFMGQKELTDMGIIYCQLPYAIHRVVGD